MTTNIQPDSRGRDMKDSPCQCSIKCNHYIAVKRNRALGTVYCPSQVLLVPSTARHTYRRGKVKTLLQF
eukprot:3239601-Amphidinium_carterae.1